MIPRSQMDAIIRQAIEQHHGCKGTAKALGVSVSTVSDTYHGRREPAETLLRKLGYRRVVLYERV